MKIIRILLVVVLSASLLAECKKDKTTLSTTIEVTPAMARDTLFAIMNSWYFWNTLMPSVNKDDYADPYTLMEAMKYKTLDRWSFVADYEAFVKEMQGSFVGHGFRIGIDDSSKARIVQIYSESPLYTYGVRRGWIVKKINDTDVAPVLLSNSSTAYSDLIGPSEAGVTNKFLFETPEGKDSLIMSTKKAITLNSVILYDTLNLSSGITGHLVFDSFISPAENELGVAFNYFNSLGIKDLIIDLRYNSGGYLYIAQELASYIAGSLPQGSKFLSLEYNSLHQDKNVTFNYLTSPIPIPLTRIVVITTRETASASECVMNGLKPYINVVSVGDTTNGKPVGMDAKSIGDKYLVAPITFKMTNKNGEGDYYAGMVPDALVSDDITRDFNDREEYCLKAAISYLETGSFTSGTAKSSMIFQKHPQYSEKPEWMKNVFLPGKAE
jgi:carboxyl-terminal processing protease